MQSVFNQLADLVSLPVVLFFHRVVNLFAPWRELVIHLSLKVLIFPLFLQQKIVIVFFFRVCALPLDVNIFLTDHLVI
jgi:hypothetical protein